MEPNLELNVDESLRSRLHNESEGFWRPEIDSVISACGGIESFKSVCDLLSEVLLWVKLY
jgi:hypothetical protein